MRRRSVLAIVAALLLTGPGVRAGADGAATFLGRVTWSTSDPHLGGMSAIEIGADGQGFTAISDKGYITTGRLVRRADGHLEGIQAAPLSRLRGQGEAFLVRGRTDSEGLAVAADGTAYISFEGPARVLRYDRLDGPATNLPRPEGFRAMQKNSSLEALAIDENGWLYTIPERSGALATPFPVWRYKDGAWDQPFSLPRTGPYLVVAADFGPDGKLYLLERDFQGIAGFSSRVRRFAIDPVSGPDQGETVLETPLGRHDNLEGLAVWSDTRGAIRLTMIADDNFRFFLRTEIVEYSLKD